LERRVFRGHHNRLPIHALAFSPDGKLLASASNDATVLLWNVFDEPQPARKGPLSTKELQALWEKLRSDKAEQAYQALCTLRAAAKETVPFLAKQLRPVSPVDPKRLDQLLRDLNSDTHAVRTEATMELGKLGTRVELALRKALAGKPALEVRRRIEILLEKLDPLSLSSEKIQPMRALEVLEHIGTTDAKGLLESLAKGAPGARLTREAQEALQRLEKRRSLLP
jgi:hypothetical protein